MVKAMEPLTGRATGDRLPSTVNEAVGALLDLLADYDDIPSLPELDAASIESLHVALGPYIRRRFGLWGTNTALLADCGCDRADDAYAMILESLAKRLRDGE